MITIPLLISSDPVVPRVFVALLSSLAVIVIVRMVTYYFSINTGLIAGLLYAVFPQLVDWGRFVWNPNLAPLFVALWLFTLLLGYLDGKRHYQIWHWIWLSLCIQSQSALLLLAPITILRTIIWHRSHRRFQDFAKSLVAIGFFIISYIPWIIGLLEHWHQSDLSNGLILKLPSLNKIVGQFFHAVIGLGVKYERFTNLHNTLIGLPSEHSNWIHLLYILIVFVGIGVIWQKKRPIAFWFLPTFMLPIGLFFIDHKYGIVNHYFMSTVMIGVVFVAVGLNNILSRFRRVGQVLFVILFVGNLWLTASHLAWFSWFGTTQYSALAHLDSMHTQVSSWHKQASIVFLQDNSVEQNVAPQSQLEWVMFWKYYEKLGWTRLINEGESIPIASDGQFIVTHHNSTRLSDILTEVQKIQLDERTGITWQYRFVQPEYRSQAQLLPIGAESFHGLMDVHGITVVDDGILLHWQSFQTSPLETYIFELEVNDQVIEKLALASYQWRFGETVITPIVVDLDHVQHIQLRLRQHPDNEYVKVSDQDTTVQRISFCLVCETNFE